MNCCRAGLLALPRILRRFIRGYWATFRVVISLGERKSILRKVGILSGDIGVYGDLSWMFLLADAQ